MKPSALFLCGALAFSSLTPFTAGAQDLSQLSQPVARGPQSDESVYFVMTDRFENGDPKNDEAGLTGGRLVSGFEPTEPGWWHGGDFKGLTNRLSYIRDMGFTAIWITPPVKQRYFQGTSAGYHGYWGIDFTTVDPHLGTEADFKELVSSAHSLGMKVIIDVVANHTADVIYYKLNDTRYIDSSKPPYKPLVAPFSKNEKKPNWLNNLSNYHNRGDSTFSGPSVLDGDFYGLDDLFTEKPAVVKGWTDVWNSWITKFDIDGLRIDTFRHVNPEFWKAVIPAVLKTAKSAGKNDFPIFGEVADANPQILSDYVQSGQTPSVLDFAFQKNLASFLRFGSSGDSMAEFFNSDDLYTTSKTSAYGLATFLGNHDMGRIGAQLFKAVPEGDSEQLLERAQLANAALFLLRGGPVLYYGDEKGMMGSGGDKLARQDMFPTQVEDWKTELRIGQNPIGSSSSFDISNPLHTQVSALQGIIRENPALRTGTQKIRSTKNGELIVTRYLDGHEYVVALNGSDESRSMESAVGTADASWRTLFGTEVDAKVEDKRISFTLPARSYTILKSTKIYQDNAEIKVTPISITTADFSSTLKELSVKINGDHYVDVTFSYRVPGKEWTIIGTSDRETVTTPQTTGGKYRVFYDFSKFPRGQKVQFIAVARGASGQLSASPIKG